MQSFFNRSRPVFIRLFAFVLLFGTALAQVPALDVQARRAGEPVLILTKSIEGGATTAQVGDVIRYRIRFECSSLTTSCGAMQIVDTLQSGLTYLPPPNSSVPAGFVITEAPAGKITITKSDNNLLDGSQFDAVIAVRVNYDLRTLPATINNTITGNIDPPGPVGVQTADPASAPPISIGVANPHWAMKKSLFSPSVDPTLDTNVTYKLDLCPTAPPPGEGNVALSNIVITDTLPAGATFVSASNGGTLALGVVTWNIAGPITPPSCVTRYVTIRYPSVLNGGTFSVGSDVINSAQATGGYLDSDGVTCPSCYGTAVTLKEHPIVVIKELPNYSKGDTGDPVGINGTARFILNLDTNATNYPSNNVKLIDNLPPQLQVTQVTSGAWATMITNSSGGQSPAFDYVQATVEYSTDNGATYTAFGPAVNYNDNVLYNAPVANITNVRWVFAYDPDGVAPFAYTQPGLPYTWSFTTSPEIRVTPRQVAVVGPPALPAVGAPLPITYTNCLQVSRTNSLGASVTDLCAPQDMTVRGDFVSLRTTKAETPGLGWDGLYDPDIINTFTPDSSILPGDTLRYVVTVDVTERSSKELINPTILDTLPADLIFVRNGTAQLDGTDLPAAQQPIFTQVGQDLKWQWKNPSPLLTIFPQTLGSHLLTVEFFARIPRGQSPGTRTNDIYVVTNSLDIVCEVGSKVADAADVDGDTNFAESACKNSDTYDVERAAALRGEKWIRSTATNAYNSQVVDMATFLPPVVPPDANCPDGGNTGLLDALGNAVTNHFTRFPCISQAFPEGALSPNQLIPPPSNTTLDDFEYNLRIFNDGNVPMIKYALYDILPYVGDNGSGGTLASKPRLSEFQPRLRGPVQFISGTGVAAGDFTIEYNLTNHPCRPEVFNQTAGAILPGGCDNNWITSAATAGWTQTNWLTVRSYRILLNVGSSVPNAVPDGDEPRFGVPMYIPAGIAQSKQIAWNSFSHVGSYTALDLTVRDLLASEPRKVGITIPERMSVGNRVWRDSDNSGTINAPDDTTPGISNVTVNLYRAGDTTTVIATATTDSLGYYLFSNIPYDDLVPANNDYVIGIPASNFAPDPDGLGPLLAGPLNTLRSSTGTPSSVTYTNPPTNTVDKADDGIDPVTPGLEVFSASFTLQPMTEPAAESDLSANFRDGFFSRGVNGERDNNSDLTMDFGFFGGTDVPFSIGNHLWYDSGQTALGVFNYAQRNDGLRQVTEPPVVGTLVNLYRDGNSNGVAEPAELIRTDLTDLNGFYLFDNLDPGQYFVEIPASEFASGKPLAGWYSSQPTGTVVVNGLVVTKDIDNDDDGINTNFPETDGVFSAAIILKRDENEPTGETYLSGQADPGLPTNGGFNPTGWDGPNSRGRYGESDITSNLTIDFGFIPPMSLGNRVWIDEGAGTLPFRAGYNNGVMDGTESGVAGVRVELWRDTDGTLGLNIATDTFIRFTTTDPTGYYLFERLQPGSDYFVHIPASNFTAGNPLADYLSSTDVAVPADDFIDKNDNGIDSVTPNTTGITSQPITMSYNGEPLTPANETDIPANNPANVTAYGTDLRGLFGQGDGDSNLTMDFGFARPPRSIGNRLWIDTNNNGQVDGVEAAVPTGVQVSLYLDANVDGQPDDLGVLGNRTDDALATDLTDVNGYYLFDNLPPNNYIVGVDRLNFAPGGLLDGYNSSKGSVDNASNNTDDRDNGVDRLLRADATASPHGILSTRINLTATPVNAPTGEVGSGNPGDGPNSRGNYGETDFNSDLTIDFGFFIPMSLGNRVWIDDGSGAGIYNNGIMDGGELPIDNVRVELWRDADANGAPDVGGMVGFDTTAAGGYYLFDNLAEGSYVVLIPSSNFTGVGPLVGYGSSTPTGTENIGVAGNPSVPNTDRDDNGINSGTTATTGILSGTIVLAHNTEPTGEIELSGQADPGSTANLDYSPTGWDGPVPGSRGRWDEIDANSNLTIDFGFIPIFSLGNRVWFDTNNSSAINGAEVGINGVTVKLYASDGTTEINVGLDGILNTADDAAGGMLTAGGGYYRFNNLPAGDYIVKIPAANFGVGQPLSSYWSSGTTISAAGAISETAAALANSDTDSDDNGTLTSGDVISSVVTLGPTKTSEPTGETNLAADGQGQPDGQANMTVDFGFYHVEIGNLVYLDGNANGNYDGAAPDAFISGATVKLYAADGTTEINIGPDGILGTADDAAGGVVTGPLAVIHPTWTAGTYWFLGLPQGQYIVKTLTPAGTYSTIDTFNAADTTTPVNTDNNDNGIGKGNGAVASGTVTMSPGLGGVTINNATGTTRNPTIDFGFVSMVALGNRLWFDTGAVAGHANNRILDTDEIGVDDGVVVELHKTSDNSLVASTTTSTVGLNRGYYQFDNLYPDTYYVFIPPTQFQAGGKLESYYSSLGNGANETSDQTVDENGIDNAAPATNGILSTNYTLLGGTEQTTEDQANYPPGTLVDANVNFTADFGFVQKYSIGNRVWFDTNNSSAINGAEAGVDGVTVNLYAASNLSVILATDTTSNGGYYLFEDLYSGDYVVSVAASNFIGLGKLNGYWSSGTTRTAAGAITEAVAALANSDTDSDDNGTIQTSGLLNGAAISSTVTLGPGGLTEPAAEGDLEPVVGQGKEADGRANMTVDFGFYTMSLGNLVWSDTDKNGAFNGTEAGIDGLPVTLWSGDGLTQIIPAINTAGGGLYNFTGLAQGDYIVRVTAPSDVASSVDTFAALDTTNPTTNTDNNDNGVGIGNGTVSSNVVTLTPGLAQTSNTVNNLTGSTANPSLDFGFVPVFSLGNRVWFDTNNNRAINGTEVGVNGVTVQLFASNGTTEIPVGPDGILGTADDAPGGMLTAGGGYYRFNNLPANDYIVSIPAGNFSGILKGYWSSATTISGAGAIAETAAALANSDIDSDDNGTRQPGGAITSSVITLGPATNSEPASESDLGAGGQGQPDTQANMTVDFGFYKVEVGNLVYNDINQNGNYESASDVVLPGIPVKLFAADGTTEILVGIDGILGTADDGAGGMLSNVSGLYLFSGLPEGAYIVKVIAPTGTDSSIDTFNSGDNANPGVNADNNDNGIGLGSGAVPSGSVTLTPGSTGALNQNTVTDAIGTTRNPTVDFGFVGMVAIGNRIWLDTGAAAGHANNGILDADEIGVDDGVRVELHKASDDSLVAFTTTSSVGADKGYYQFDQLYPGTYYVSIPASEFASGKPLFEFVSTFNAGANETSDQTVDENGIDSATLTADGIRTRDYTLTPGSMPLSEDQANYPPGTLVDDNVNFTADFGFVQKYSLGNRIWFDTNNNSQMDSGEVGKDGVVVDLYNADASRYPTGAAIATDTTTGGGFYLFDDLFPRDYVVVVAQSNFAVGGVLNGYWSSATSVDASGALIESLASAPNTDIDVDDNGMLDTSAGALNGAVISKVVTLGPGSASEPTGELAAQLESGVLGSQGNQPDARANMTVDFGFYKVEVGDLIYSDGNKNGNYESASDVVLSNVIVKLFASDGTTEIQVGADGKLGTADDGVGGMPTDAGGIYLFSGLPAGAYIVTVTAPAGTSSTVDIYNVAGDNTTPNINADDNDNGIGTGGGAVSSGVFNLTPGSGGALSSNTVSDATGTTYNPTLDFGFIPVFSLGNRVWFDTDNSSTINGSEVGVAGVTVQLFASDGTTEILVGADGILGTADDLLGGKVTTSVDGYYLFNNLPSGDYIVSIPASNFTGVLKGYWSSATNRTAALTETIADLANSDTDSNDNGTLQPGGAVVSSVVTLGPNTNTEPASESDLDLGGQGQPDTQANMTVDFGFYTITLGDLVWEDLNNDGLASGEFGLSGVDVQLWSKDGIAPLATTTTVGGIYSFTGLPEGNYYVRIPASEFNPLGILRDYVSSTGSATAPFAYEPGKNVDGVTVDSDDNGTVVGSALGPDGTYNSSLGLGGYVQSNLFALTPAAEQSVNDTVGLTVENRVDFGFYASAMTDLSVTKTDNVTTYIPNGVLNYTITVTNHGPSDVVNAQVDDALPAQIASWTWTCAAGTPAAYNCSGASANSSAFQDLIDLPQNASVTYDVAATVIASPANVLDNKVTVTPPAGIAELDATNNTATDSDDLASLTISKDDSLSIVSPGSTIKYEIVVKNTGMVDLTSINVTDTLPADLTYDSASLVPVKVGNLLTWSGLSLTVGSQMTISVTAIVAASPSGTITNTVNVKDTTTGANATDNDVDNVAISDVKTLTATSELASGNVPPANPEPVFIGETLIYTISITLPPGTATNLIATDIMEAGLAFDECTATGVTTLLAYTGPGCPAAIGDPNVTNTGHQVIFDFGTVTNNSGADRTITVEYQAIVLDIPANVNGVSGLNNRVTWTWDGGSLSGSADPVKIIEPVLKINKDAAPRVAALGSTITFTVSIAHTKQSTADAYDVVVADVLPAGFGYIAGSAVFSSGNVPPTSIVEAGNTLTVTWDYFPLQVAGSASTATITLQATFIGPAPVTNEASVAWTSLPIDPGPGGAPVQQSSYNVSSTERWYDPLNSAGVDNYRVASSVAISVPQHLPSTGFAPDVVTTLPEMPAGFSYATSNLWVEIPRLDKSLNIVGVPFGENNWNLTWLGSDAGWLEGSTYPTHKGNSALTAHAVLANGLPGPFAKLNSLKYGDRIIVHLDGQKYIYVVRETLRVRPDSAESVLRHEELSWLTLITCQSYDEDTKSYRYRVIIRAVLLSVE